ncbi:hypothetical protein ACFL5H_02870 [Candidatus Latescibacterota bacterium]
MGTYSTFDICKLFNIPKGRFREWVDQGFVKPSIDQAKGIGTKNIFSRWDLYGIAIFARALSSGIDRLTASFFYDLWIKNTRSLDIEQRFGFKYLLVSIRQKHLVDNKPRIEHSKFIKEGKAQDEILEDLEKYDFYHIFSIQRIIAAVDKKLKG